MSSDYAGNAANTLPGANQLLKQGTHSGANVTASSNKVQPGRLKSQGPSHGSTTARTQALPLGLIQND